MEKKNIYTLLFIGLGIALIFTTGLYSGWVIGSVKSIGDIPFISKLSANKAGQGNNPALDNNIAAKPKDGVLSFLPLSGEQQKDRNFSVKVVMDTQGQLTYGADVFINYDPSVLELATNNENASQGQVGNKIIKSWADGKIVFSFLAPAGNTWQHEIELATLNFIPKQIGATDLKFLLEANPANACHIAGAEGQDILGKVFNAHFEIK